MGCSGPVQLFKDVFKIPDDCPLALSLCFWPDCWPQDAKINKAHFSCSQSNRYKISHRFFDTVLLESGLVLAMRTWQKWWGALFGSSPQRSAVSRSFLTQSPKSPHRSGLKSAERTAGRAGHCVGWMKRLAEPCLPVTPTWCRCVIETGWTCQTRQFASCLLPGDSMDTMQGNQFMQPCLNSWLVISPDKIKWSFQAT